MSTKKTTDEPVPPELMAVGVCPNCGREPVVNKKTRRGKTWYWLSCPGCEYPGPECQTEYEARNWWNRNLSLNVDTQPRMNIGCFKTDVIEKLCYEALKEGGESGHNSTFVDLTCVISARKRIPMLQKKLENSEKETWLRKEELRTTLASVGISAMSVSPHTYEWMIEKLCERYMKGGGG